MHKFYVAGCNASKGKFYLEVPKHLSRSRIKIHHMGSYPRVTDRNNNTYEL
jgi:hypothetical protein